MIESRKREDTVAAGTKRKDMLQAVQVVPAIAVLNLVILIE